MIKKIIYFFAGVCILTACGENKSESTTTESPATEAPIETVKPSFAYPVRYSEWEIGKPENTKTVIDFYYAWDKKDLGKIASLCADSVILRLPTERDEIKIPNSEISERVLMNRSMYDSTSNYILSAVSLHDKESNEDWVMITTYNKWVEKDGKRDSLVYHDNWKLKEGKINFLMSFDKVVSKEFIKKNEPKK